MRRVSLLARVQCNYSSRGRIWRNGKAGLACSFNEQPAFTLSCLALLPLSMVASPHHSGTSSAALPPSQYRPPAPGQISEAQGGLWKVSHTHRCPLRHRLLHLAANSLAEANVGRAHGLGCAIGAPVPPRRPGLWHPSLTSLRTTRLAPLLEVAGGGSKSGARAEECPVWDRCPGPSPYRGWLRRAPVTPPPVSRRGRVKHPPATAPPLPGCRGGLGRHQCPLLTAGRALFRRIAESEEPCTI